MSAMGLAGLIVAAAISLAPPPGDESGRLEPLPRELEGVGITEHLGEQVPLDVEFVELVDSDERVVRLRDLLRPGVPIVLTMNYSNCALLCSLQLDGLVGGLQQLAWSVGKQFDVVTISIDPTEKPERAQRTKERYLGQYGRQEPAVQQGWHFLVGEESQIQAVAKAVGFGYRYVPEQDQYAHAPAAILLSPDGKVSRYLYGIIYEPQTLRLSLVEASAGRVGSVMDQVLLYCFKYDASAGKYAPLARNVMRLGGAVTVLVLGGVLLVLWRRDGRKNSGNKTT